jgi:hypothetical protein
MHYGDMSVASLTCCPPNAVVPGWRWSSGDQGGIACYARNPPTSKFICRQLLSTATISTAQVAPSPDVEHIQTLSYDIEVLNRGTS